jgi:G:T/U-mismatch repair DNA glycosylase
MSLVIDVDLLAMSYEQKFGCLLHHGVGLWDVVAEAKREGSLDSSIRDHEANDLLTVTRSLPNYCRLAVTTFAKNGTKASKPASIQNATGKPTDLETNPIAAGPARFPA